MAGEGCCEAVDVGAALEWDGAAEAALLGDKEGTALNIEGDIEGEGLERSCSLGEVVGQS